MNLGSDMLADWVSDLRASRKSHLTVRSYQLSVRCCIESAGDDLAGLTRRSVGAWLGNMAEDGYKSSTQQLRFHGDDDLLRVVSQ